MLQGLRFLTKKNPYILMIIVIAFLGFLMWYRMEKGVELADKSYYIAMPMRIIEGDRPYLEVQDEIKVIL